MTAQEERDAKAKHDAAVIRQRQLSCAHGKRPELFIRSHGVNRCVHCGVSLGDWEKMQQQAFQFSLPATGWGGGVP